MKLSAAQTKALQTIAENPGNVVATLRLSQLKHMVKINGNVETTLDRAGLIEEVHTGRTVTHSGGTCKVNTWELTTAGRVAIGQTTPPKLTEKATTAVDDHAAAVAKIRANIDAEEEERAAARRARNRTSYTNDKSGMDSLRDMLKLY
jgi:hypothetical protein